MSIIDTAKAIYELAKKGANMPLQEQLIQLREEALTLQEENIQLKETINGLKNDLKTKEQFEFDGSVYWQILDDTSREGPFCQRCYDVDEKLIRLQDHSYEDEQGMNCQLWSCVGCGRSFTQNNR